jgi:hypothetical protein
VGKSLADIRAVLAGKQANRKARQLSSDEVKRLAKLEGLLDVLKRGENVQNRTLQTWLTDSDWQAYLRSLDEQKELRAEFADKPTDLVKYERLMRDAMFSHNRADGYAGKGHLKTAQKFRYKAEAQFERALEHLEECLAADPQLQLWLDRNVDTGPEGNVNPSSPVTMPRVVTSRSLDRAGSGFRQMYKSKRQLKVEVVMGAIDRLKFEG